MKIVEFDKNYLDDCINLFIKVFNSEPWNDKWTLDKASKFFHNQIKHPSFRGYMGLVDNRIVGVCLGHIDYWWEGHSFYIDEFYIGNESQRSGYGSKMMEHVEIEMKKVDIQSVILLTARDTLAEDFYKKNDFYNIDAVTLMKKRI